ncbi:MAG: DUF3772 domain-containing protein [Roseinatronobacter sp.]
MSVLKALLLALICAIALPLSSGMAQELPAAQTNGPPDYDAWRRQAQAIEALIDSRIASEAALTDARQKLVSARSAFLAAQDANQSRIASVREQIAALGPVPEEGVTEAPEIAARRAELAEQLAALQTPGIAAQEAFRRADGLVRQIDTILRERQALALLTLSPSPLNPSNWVLAVDSVYGTTFAFVTQMIGTVEDPARRREFFSNLPIVLVLLGSALFVLARGRRWIEALVQRLYVTSGEKSAPGRRMLASLTSLAQIVVPVVAVLALSVALETSALLGPVAQEVNAALTAAGLGYFTARWAGRQVFPLTDMARSPLRLPDARRREGRVMSNLVGIFLAAYILTLAYLPPDNQSDAANSVIVFPLLVLAGIVLFRLGRLMMLHRRLNAEGPEETSFLDRVIGVLGRAAVVIGIGAPIFAAIGYVQAAEALLFPAIMSLGLVTVLIFLIQLVDDVFAIVTKRGPDAPDALVPALISFALVLTSLPLFALIWGVRPAELLEVWQILREGFRVGETRISPTNIISFAIVFGIGYMLTRLVQGALASTVLPKTKIDKGGQKAVISGTGYFGIFVAALTAISTAGIDLSGLAIVAGALSVGIGFGLQNIVSNFISGLILLIERPVAEGDWIEVGGTMGTVRSISVRSTVIETFDRTDVIVPNADLISGRVTNWTRFNSLGRITIKVGVAYGSDTRKVQSILKELGDAQPLAVLNPAPIVLFSEFGADALEFELRVVLSDVTFANDVRTELRHQILERFRAEGIEIPFAQRDVWLRNPEALTGRAPIAAPAAAAVAGSAAGVAAAQPLRRGTFEDSIDFEDPDIGPGNVPE